MGFTMAQSPQSNVYRLLIHRALALERDRFAESEAAYQTAVLLRTADPEMHMVVISMRNQGASWRTILTHIHAIEMDKLEQEMRNARMIPNVCRPLAIAVLAFHWRGR
jgi:hypothetical protein